MKKFIKACSLLFVLCFSLLNTASVSAASAEPDVNAKGSVLIDASSGTVLWGKNEEKTFEPASTTKVMTALVTLQKCSLDDTVKVTQDFTEIDGTAVGLLKGDELTVRDLLQGMLMESGNDCANALAIHISGSVEAFGDLMTQKAKALGATHTTFKNPSGLPDEGHLTTPHDLALIMREAIKSKAFMKITQTPYYKIRMKNNPKRILIANNKNHMINENSRYYYKYAISGKNGYTIRANHTYVCAAEKDGHILVASFLNAENKPQNFEDMKTVFEYGFNNYSWTNLYKADTAVENYKISNSKEIPLMVPQDINYVAKNGSSSNVKPEIKIENKDLCKESFNKGDAILKADIYVNGKEYMKTDLLAGESYEYTPPLIPHSAAHLTTIQLASIGGGALVGLALITISIVHLKKKNNKLEDSIDFDDDLPDEDENIDETENNSANTNESQNIEDENLEYTQTIKISPEDNNKN